MTYSERFTHINGYPSAAGLDSGAVQGKFAGQRPTYTELHRQPIIIIIIIIIIVIIIHGTMFMVLSS